MRSVNPYLNFEGNTEEAFELYRSVFVGDFAAALRLRDAGSVQFALPAAQAA